MSKEPSRQQRVVRSRNDFLDLIEVRTSLKATKSVSKRGRVDCFNPSVSICRCLLNRNEVVEIFADRTIFKWRFASIKYDGSEYGSVLVYSPSAAGPGWKHGNRRPFNRVVWSVDWCRDSDRICRSKTSSASFLKVCFRVEC